LVKSINCMDFNFINTFAKIGELGRASVVGLL
jgi:hypothetical protein